MLPDNAEKLDSREQHYWIESPSRGMRLFLRYLPSISRQSMRVRAGPVRSRCDLSAGAVYRAPLGWLFLAGRSLRRGIRRLGIRLSLLWILRQLSRNDRATGDEPVALPHSGCKRTVRGSGPVHSSMARCAETIYHPPLLEFYVERPFRRTTPHNGGPHCALWRHRQPPAAPAWRIVAVEDQWARFVEDVSRLEQPVLLPAHFDEWSERYLDADPDSRSREPAGVKTPTGPFTDILHGWHGALAYEPALYRLRSQSFAANGTDSLATTTPDGYSKLSVVRLSSVTSRSARATHLMDLEVMRYALYRESIAFLAMMRARYRSRHETISVGATTKRR